MRKRSNAIKKQTEKIRVFKIEELLHTRNDTENGDIILLRVTIKRLQMFPKWQMNIGYLVSQQRPKQIVWMQINNSL